MLTSAGGDGDGGDAVRRLAAFLRAATAVSGLLVLVTGGGSVRTAVALAAWAAGVAAIVLLDARVPSRRTVAAVAEGLLGAAVVAATGGDASPLLLALVGPVVLAGFRGDTATVLGLATLGVPAMASTGSPLQVATNVVVLAAVGGLGTWYRNRLTPVDPPSRIAVELDRLRLAGRLLALADRRLDGRALPSSTEDLLHEVRDLLAPLVEPDVIALRVGDGLGQGWARLGADDVVRTGAAAPLPTALLAADVGDPVVLLGDVPPGDGLDPLSRRAAYLWLEVDGGRAAVLALEWDQPGTFSATDARTIDELRELLQELAAADANLRRLRDSAEAGERSRLAARLHDDLGQDLAYLVVELERAARRHPDDRELPVAAEVLRDAVGRVRQRIGSLRHEVSVASPARRVAAALAGELPCRVVAADDDAVGGAARVDAAVAVAVAVARAAAAAAPAVTVRDARQDGEARLELLLHGVAVDGEGEAVATAVAEGRRAGLVVDVRAWRTVGTWVIVQLASGPSAGRDGSRSVVGTGVS